MRWILLPSLQGSEIGGPNGIKNRSMLQGSTLLQSADGNPMILEYYFDLTGPGAALAIVGKTGAPIIECVGLSDIGAGVPITPDTEFELASASKIVTATAVMQLVEQKRLELGSPVSDFISEWEDSSKARPVTIKDLLSHTSGLTDYLEAGMYTPPDRMTAAFVMGHLPEWSLAALPGKQHQYSNTNYFVLARVVEALSRSTFSEFVEENLFRRFDLLSTSVHPGETPASSVATGYRNLGYGLPFVVPNDTMEIDTNGDGGVRSTLNDLIRWQSLFWGCQIVTEQSLVQMRTAGTLDSGKTFEYGIGLQVESRGSGDIWCGHGGSWTNTTTLIGRYLNVGIDVIVLSNEFMAPVERISQCAASLARDR